MSLADLRKELKDLRKNAMPTPVSRMRKTECAREIERLKGLHRGEEKKEHVEHKAEVKEVKKVLKKEEVAKPVAEKVVKAQEKAHKKEEKETKKEHKKEEETMKPSKYIKGSQEAKDRMAAIRNMRKAKADE